MTKIKPAHTPQREDNKSSMFGAFLDSALSVTSSRGLYMYHVPEINYNFKYNHFL